MRGGSKPGERRGGRQRGSRNKRTVAREAAMRESAEKIEAAIGDAFQGDAHALLVAIYKDPRQDVALRVDAAKTAIRYELPALASAKVEFKDPLAKLTDEDLTALVSAFEGTAVSVVEQREETA